MRTYLILLVFAFLPSLVSAQLVGDTENGLASYYSKEYNGAETSYNVIYNKDELVAAHRQFPYNSTVRVKNMENNKSVVVRIIDEGPFIRSRIIELSEKAATMLDMIGKETVPVELTLLSTPSQPATVSSQAVPTVQNNPQVDPAESTPTTSSQVQTPPVTQPAPEPAAPAITKTEKDPAASSANGTASAADKKQAARPLPTVSDAKAEVKATPVSTSKTSKATTFAPGVYKIELNEVEGGKFGVQVGSFGSLEAAMDKVAEMQSKWFDNVLIQRINNGKTSTYKVILGPFGTDASALRYASDLKKRYKISGFTVELE
jgi:rare lipoprotein A